jgi:D-inositol-3-phosphate glycosyltransferase
MMRCIALISEHASPLAVPGSVDSGGQNVYVAQVAKYLAAAGHRVDVFTRRDCEDVPTVVEWAPGVRVIHVQAGPAVYVPKEQLFPYMGEFTDWMRQFLASEALRYDILHANFWMSGMVAAELKRTLGIPFVITFHALGRVRRRYQGAADHFPDLRFAVEDRIIAEADAIIAECPQDKDDLTCLYRAEDAAIRIIPCGFDPSELAPVPKTLARRKLGFEADERIVLQLGRLVPRKGVDTVIRGVARLIKQHGYAARLVIVGGDTAEPDPTRTPEIGRLQTISADEGIADHVLFTGYRPRDVLRYWYSAADIFAVTPWYEPFGITPLEAMACGTPVVGADVGGIKYSVCNGETGFLVPPNDPEALAERLAYLYAHPTVLASLGRQAIRHVNTLFTWRQVTAALADLYEEVIMAQSAGIAAIHGGMIIDRGFAGLVEVALQSRGHLRPAILEAADAISACFAAGGKLLICGNGGSAADAQHFAAELVGRFKQEDRPGLPALPLTADTATLTAWSNDRSFEDVFARQVQAFGHPGDVLLGISTSGRSRNLVRAFEVAERLQIARVALLGRDGGDLRALADTAVVVPSYDSQHIQEMHLVIVHLICEIVEERWCTQRRQRSIVTPLAPALKGA